MESKVRTSRIHVGNQKKRNKAGSRTRNRGGSKAARRDFPCLKRTLSIGFVSHKQKAQSNRSFLPIWKWLVSPPNITSPTITLVQSGGYRRVSEGFSLYPARMRSQKRCVLVRIGAFLLFRSGFYVCACSLWAWEFARFWQRLRGALRCPQIRFSTPLRKMVTSGFFGFLWSL